MLPTSRLAVRHYSARRSILTGDNLWALEVLVGVQIAGSESKIDTHQHEHKVQGTLVDSHLQSAEHNEDDTPASTIQ